MQNTAYELNLPDLVDHTFRYSIDGWVIVSHWNSFFFFSSFTGKKIDIHLGTYCSDGVAVSSSPTNWEDCLVFSIFEGEQGEGIIELVPLSDGSATCLNYVSNLPFNLFSSSPVYHRGLFYCLGHTGNLGVYDPEANTWIVSGLFLPLDISMSRRKCYLFESDSNLFSVIIDEYENRIRVYEFDSFNVQWAEVRSYLEDKALFVAKESCFEVPAVDRRMLIRYIRLNFGESTSMSCWSGK